MGIVPNILHPPSQLLISFKATRHATPIFHYKIFYPLNVRETSLKKTIRGNSQIRSILRNVLVLRLWGLDKWCDFGYMWDSAVDHLMSPIGDGQLPRSFPFGSQSTAQASPLERSFPFLRYHIGIGFIAGCAPAILVMIKFVQLRSCATQSGKYCIPILAMTDVSAAMSIRSLLMVLGYRCQICSPVSRQKSITEAGNDTGRLPKDMHIRLSWCHSKWRCTPRSSSLLSISPAQGLRIPSRVPLIAALAIILPDSRSINILPDFPRLRISQLKRLLEDELQILPSIMAIGTKRLASSAQVIV
ncbi:uncharacterized protein MYCFIDRAFT_178512 [Pseudocercospora fijiensis CIRAD86]|uniref:Uncharacterized protein n=1 Tax=Pseudocercospora fijiensis (strain CIRAD86) TaxID=383855 RepID=M2ZGV3_PSEFD|nr:uncharacterized protein MYCFIDRAFT_178512 [Pseudocercospora fijiensis CIRAD86]EME78364.1 hypothetical protein MYCFIDRAFT_178512 [Pseudocercospora fijiensis CIRAD86]